MDLVRPTAAALNPGSELSRHPTDTRRRISVVLTLVHRLRRWLNVKPTLIQRRVSVPAGQLPVLPIMTPSRSATNHPGEYAFHIASKVLSFINQFSPRHSSIIHEKSVSFTFLMTKSAISSVVDDYLAQTDL